MVITDLYSPVLLFGSPMAFRIFLRWRRTLATIMSVRRTLSDTEIEKYGMPMLAAREFHMLTGCEVL